MPSLLSDRLRQALRDFKHAAANRAKLELETESGFRERSQALENEYHTQLQQIETSNQEAMAEAEHEVQSARIRTQAQTDLSREAQVVRKLNSVCHPQ